jgi:hypothetical protein
MRERGLVVALPGRPDRLEHARDAITDFVALHVQRDACQRRTSAGRHLGARSTPPLDRGRGKSDATSGAAILDGDEPTAYVSRSPPPSAAVLAMPPAGNRAACT